MARMTDPTIPGLEVAAPPPGKDGPMAKAAHVTLLALADAHAISPRHQVLVQLVQSLAGAIDAGVASGRASAVAMAAKQLLETMLVLDPPEGPAASGDAMDKLEALFARLELEANGAAPRD